MISSICCIYGPYKSRYMLEQQHTSLTKTIYYCITIFLDRYYAVICTYTVPFLLCDRYSASENKFFVTLIYNSISFYSILLYQSVHSAHRHSTFRRHDAEKHNLSNTFLCPFQIFKEQEQSIHLKHPRTVFNRAGLHQFKSSLLD